MNALSQSKRMNARDFLAWAGKQDRGRFQLIAGKVLAMAPERADHARAKYALVKAFEAGIKRGGLPCEAFIDGLQVVVDDETVFEPDALVNCGEKTPSDSIIATNPVIVAEVISPSSERRDLSAKLLDYFRVPSIQHYLVIHLPRRLVLHHRRGEGGTIITAIVKEGALLLQPPKLEIEVASIFDGQNVSDEP
jgi:Uma2 family endonuclease